MTKVQIVSSGNSAWYLFCSKKGYEIENVKYKNKKPFENLAFTVLYLKLYNSIYK